MIVRADAGLGGVLFIVAVIIANILSAFRRGKPPLPPVAVPAPVPSRPAAPAKRMRYEWEEPVAVPVPAAVVPPPAPDVDEAVRRLEAAEAALNAPAAPHAWARLHIHGREEWQKAFILSEVVQPPLSLRPDW